MPEHMMHVTMTYISACLAPFCAAAPRMSVARGRRANICLELANCSDYALVVRRMYILGAHGIDRKGAKLEAASEDSSRVYPRAPALRMAFCTEFCAELFSSNIARVSRMHTEDSGWRVGDE